MSTQTASGATSPVRHRSPRLYIILLVILCVLFVAGYLQRLSTLESIRQQVADMREQVAASEQRRANLEAQLAQVQDPYYLALMARDDIGLVQEGDLPVVVYDGPPAEEVPENQPATAPSASDKPIWQQWLDLIMQGNAR